MDMRINMDLFTFLDLIRSQWQSAEMILTSSQIIHTTTGNEFVCRGKYGWEKDWKSVRLYEFEIGKV